MDLDMVHTTRITLLGIVLSDTIHTGLIHSVIIHTATIHLGSTHIVHTMVLVVMDITLTVMEWVDWDGVDMATEMDGWEMVMVGEVL